MTNLVVGATGATGRLLVRQLLDRGQSVRALVRSPEKLADLQSHEHLEVVEGQLDRLTPAELAELTQGCTAVGCCLGHNLSFAGVFGPPWRLVTNATRRICEALLAHQPDSPVRLVLMNTAGNRNRDLNEQVSLAHRALLGVIRILIPPHPDNEQAAEYLRTSREKLQGAVEWVVVRPDSLIDEDQVSSWTLHPSPTTSALFAAQKTSRINVAACMADLIAQDELWAKWRGQMPVLYNGNQ